ncbi:hypothetical protein CNMCM8694_006750 [Aspergillus lentulus]|nr:hypothetical protein CNMCM8060_006910 [Aspergillus lentulus]KAF4198997.1 hypothetical protein CNMCM8694_006750 [Aspergillus lentulus]
MDQRQKRSTMLPHGLQKNSHPRDDQGTLQKLDEKLSSLHASEARLTQLQGSTGQEKANKITKSYRHTQNQSAPEAIKNNDFLKREHPSGKYLMTWEVNQAGIGRLGLENCAGYKSRVVVKKIIAGAQHQSKNLRATDDQYLVNLQEVFFDQGYYFLVYPFQGFTIDLAVTCATPHVQFSEADIATVCRSILKGLDYIHEVLQVSHGNLDLKHILLSENGCIKIGVSATFLLVLFLLTLQVANIGRSLLEHQSLKGRRDDIKSVGLFVVYLKEPATILEDQRTHLYNPQNVSNQAKGFIEDAHTASCKILLQHDFLLQANPDNETWSLIPHYYDASNTDASEGGSPANSLTNYLCGFAKIKLRHLSGEYRKKNMLRFKRALMGGQCSLLDPEHHITALIDMNTLNKGLEKSDINAAALLNAIDPPHLSLDDAVILACLRGRDLLEAARRVLPPGQSPDRYSEGLPVILRTEITESFSCVDGVSNVEIFGTLLRDFSAMKSTFWRSRLPSDSDFQYVQRVVQTVELREPFMALISFPGLWKTFTFRKLEHVVSPRCDEVMVHYLREIIRIWSLLLPDRAGQADTLSVELIEGKMPKYSTQDRSDIMRLMNDGTLFPHISDVNERDRILQVLLEIPGRVLSLTLFFDDAKCFSGPSRAMRDLFSVGPKTSVYSTALHCWEGSTQAYNIQLSDSEYQTVPINGIVPPDEVERAIASVSLLQLWLTAFRHFINPRTGRTRKAKNVQPLFELRGEPELAKSASRLGFTIPRKISTAVDSILPAFHYTFETLAGASHNDLARKTLYMSKRFRHIFGDGPRSHQSDQRIPELSVKTDTRRSSFRAGRPLKDEYISDRSFFFLRHMFSDEGEISLYASSFAVIRDIFCCFFGRQHLGSLLNHDTSGASNQLSLAEESPEGALTPEALLPEQPQALTDNTAVHTDSVENSDSLAASPIDLELHPEPGPSTQIMDGVQKSVPLAAGFEDEHSKAPVSRKVPISLHRSAIHEILPLWYQSDVTNVVVFYLFNSREYYKFFADSEMEMRLVLNDLARAHYFLIIDEENVVCPNISDLVSEAQRTRLLFVGARSKPGELETRSGGISKAALEDYISKYDVHTGKRRLEFSSGDTDHGEQPHSTKRRI